MPPRPPAAPERLVRRLTTDDFAESLALGLEAFGALPPGVPAPTPESSVSPARHAWGSFEDGRLVARVVGREFHSWFGGVEVATCGLAGVTVVAERRGAGLLEELVVALLGEARERGEVLSTLFPTAPGIYRRFGFELIGSLDDVEVPTRDLASVRAPAGVHTRRATAADFEAVRGVYDTWAAAQNGPLTRRGPSFTASAEEFVAEFTGVTLAVDEAGGVVGYASWQRGSGYDASATLEVSDLLALSADGYRALWRVLGSFAAVTGQVRLSTSGDEVARLVLPTGTWQVVRRRPYMLRVHDVAGALAARPLPGDADLAFTVAGDPVGTMDGGYRLRVAGGVTSCARTEPAPAAPVFGPQGLALAYAGVQSCANLRMAGLLTGPATHDATLDALFGGRQVHIRDYF